MSGVEKKERSLLMSMVHGGKKEMQIIVELSRHVRDKRTGRFLYVKGLNGLERSAVYPTYSRGKYIRVRSSHAHP